MFCDRVVDNFLALLQDMKHNTSTKDPKVRLCCPLLLFQDKVLTPTQDMVLMLLQDMVLTLFQESILPFEFFCERFDEFFLFVFRQKGSIRASQDTFLENICWDFQVFQRHSVLVAQVNL